jgi:hypothetical protein
VFSVQDVNSGGVLAATLAWAHPHRVSGHFHHPIPEFVSLSSAGQSAPETDSRLAPHGSRCGALFDPRGVGGDCDRPIRGVDYWELQTTSRRVTVLLFAQPGDSNVVRRI